MVELVDTLRETQGADPDPRIRMDTYSPPLIRGDPDRFLPRVRAQTWETVTTGRSGNEWEVSVSNVRVWAAHRFEKGFGAGTSGDPVEHPLFQLRLDLLEYEALFARFVGIPHDPRPEGRRWELPAARWGTPTRSDDPELVRVTATPAPWLPPSEHLWRCLTASRRDYAEGLTLYLLPGREGWGK